MNDGPELFIMSCDNLNADRYQWYKNGKKIPEAIRNYYIVGSEKAGYSVEIEQDGFECCTRSDELLIPSLTTGIGMLVENDHEIKIIPNPSNGLFSVLLNSSEVKVKKLSLIDIYGKVVYLTVPTNSKNEYTLEIEHLPKGIYLLRIYTDKEGAVTKKILLTN